MRIIHTEEIISNIREMCIEANHMLTPDMQKALEACTNSIRVVTDMIRTANEEREKVTQSIEVLTHLATDNAASTEETSSMTTELEGTVERSSGMIEKLEGDMKVLADSMEHFRL